MPSSTCKSSVDSQIFSQAVAILVGFSIFCRCLNWSVRFLAKSTNFCSDGLHFFFCFWGEKFGTYGLSVLEKFSSLTFPRCFDLAALQLGIARWNQICLSIMALWETCTPNFIVLRGAVATFRLFGASMVLTNHYCHFLPSRQYHD